MSDLYQQSAPQAGLKRLVAFVLFSVVCIAGASLTPLGRYFSVENISRVAGALGPWGPVLIVAAGLITPLFFVPRWPIAFVSGLLYGVVWGSLLANVASALGAWLHFTLAKSLLAPSARRLLEKTRGTGFALPRDRAFLALFFLRAFPLSSFVATNLLAGALRIPARTYVAASFLGMIPSTLMYAAWGKLMKRPSPWFYALAVITLAVIAVGTVVAQKYLLPRLRKNSETNVER